MPTAKQSAASRANGQKSRGPITAEGKAKSRFNALKHGIHAETQIMFDETAEALAELAAELHEQYQPADATERFLVDTLIHNEWRLRRMRRVEADLWLHASDAFLGQNMELNECTSGDCFATVSAAFDRLQRIVTSCERSYHRALKELVARAHGLQTPQPEQSETTSNPSGSFRDISPASPETPANPIPEAVPDTHMAHALTRVAQAPV
jgi:hypothetical protein